MPLVRTTRAGRRFSKRATPCRERAGIGCGCIQYDPVREIANLDRVLGMFDKRFGRPKRVIQYGCSGGGAVGLFIAEDFSNRIDGVIASAAHIPGVADEHLSRRMVRPEGADCSGAADRGSSDSSLRRRGPRDRRGPARGVAAGDQCCAADSGGTGTNRAGLYHRPVAGLGGAPPDSATALADTAALQHSMYHTLFHNADNPGGEARIRKELAASGQQLSWNTGHRLPGVLRERQRVLHARRSATVSGGRSGSRRRPRTDQRLFRGSRLPPTRSSGGTRLGGQRKALRRFHSCGCTKSAINRCRSAWCRAMEIWFVQTARTTCIASPW